MRMLAYGSYLLIGCLNVAWATNIVLDHTGDYSTTDRVIITTAVCILAGAFLARAGVAAFARPQ